MYTNDDGVQMALDRLTEAVLTQWYGMRTAGWPDPGVVLVGRAYSSFASVLGLRVIGIPSWKGDDMEEAVMVIPAFPMGLWYLITWWFANRDD